MANRSRHAKFRRAVRKRAKLLRLLRNDPVLGSGTRPGTFPMSRRSLTPGKFPFPSVLTQPGKSPGRVCDGLDQGYLHWRCELEPRASASRVSQPKRRWGALEARPWLIPRGRSARNERRTLAELRTRAACGARGFQ